MPKMRKVELYDIGHYADLAGRKLPRGAVVQFIPSLAAILTRAEQLKQSQLLREEVMRVRDRSMVLVAPREAARAVEQQRGYVDVDPTRVWQSWLQLRPKSRSAAQPKQRQKKTSNSGRRKRKPLRARGRGVRTNSPATVNAADMSASSY